MLKWYVGLQLPKTADIVENVLCSSHLIVEVKWEEDNWHQ